MRCEELRPLFEEYIDGELAADTRGTVAEHVANCSSCAAKVALLEREQQVYASYDRGFEPNAGVAWAAVMQQVSADDAARPVVEARGGLLARLGEWLTLPRLAPLAAVAAAVVIAVSVGLLPDETAIRDVAKQPDMNTAPAPKDPIPSPSIDDREPSQPPSKEVAAVVEDHRPVKTRPGSARRPARTTTPEPSLPEPVVTAERQYLEAIAVLSRDVERGNASIDPALRQDMRKPLEEIDRNIAAARQAVEKSPDDPTAVLGMLAAYDAKVDTLQQLARYQVARDR